MHPPELGAAVQGRKHLAGIEQALGVEGRDGQKRTLVNTQRLSPTVVDFWPVLLHLSDVGLDRSRPASKGIRPRTALARS
jgi:hypothetical protein